ncbi:hypothetical protein QTP88_028818 [Uroleucon formosanum]
MRSDLTDVTLQHKSIYINNVLRFPFLSPPPVKNLLYTMEMLKAFEANDKSGNLTYSFGTIMAELPLPAKHSRILLKSAEMGCSSEIISILAILQLQDTFVCPKVLYDELLETIKTYIKNLVEITFSLLLEVAPCYFSTPTL